MAYLGFRLPAIRLNDRRAPAPSRHRPTRSAQALFAAWESRAMRPAGVARAGEACAHEAQPESSSWFESTWDLQQGLDVAECSPADLPLALWLQVELAA
jgi:hypothetical protein